MPNWCVNRLTVHGKPTEINKFILDVSSDEGEDAEQLLDFDKIIPYPKKFDIQDRKYRKLEAKIQDLEHKTRMKYKDIDSAPLPVKDEIIKLNEIRWEGKDGYNSGGYEWCIAKWGTKWNANEISRALTTKGVVYEFDTAWSPPCPIVIKLSKRYPSLRFMLRYWEGGSGYQGVLKVQNGITKEHAEWDYHGSKGG